MSVILNTAISGLQAAQRSLDVIANNVSNAGKEGFTRKILPQETLTLDGIGIGVRLNEILRKVDMTLVRDLVRQVSVSSGATVRESYLSRIQDFHGASEAQRSIAADIGKLSNAFSELSTSPHSAAALAEVVNVAENVARTFNNQNTLLMEMRNDVQKDISSSVSAVNRAMAAIVDLNLQISTLSAQGRSTAALEDLRDQEIRDISQYLEISTYRGENNRLIVMTKRGEVLADDSYKTLTFTETPVHSGSYYPGGNINGLMLDGVDISTGNLGGKIGSLIELRDKTIPTYQAQIDEAAQKLAERFDAVGLRLFTDANRLVPLSSDPPAVVSYVGFAGEIRVNPDIIADNTLLRTGTYGQASQTGSNEMIRKVTDYVFGLYVRQEAVGTTDISLGTLFASTGLQQENRIIGAVNLLTYTPDLDAAPNITAPTSFEILIGATPYTIAINPGDTATDLVNTINATVGSPVAVLNQLGQLRLESDQLITINPGALGAAGLADLGLTTGSSTPENPSFTVQVGTQTPVTISIAPGDTAADILAALNAIPGLDAALGPGGGLELRPINGGDLALTNLSGAPLQALNLTINNVPHRAFRSANMGPDGSLSTGLVSGTTIGDFARGLISYQSEEHSAAKSAAERETTFYETLNQRNNDTSGVNLDQEMTELIRMQASYSAAARMIAAAEKMLDELFSLVRF